MGIYPKTRRSAPCAPDCTCGKHARRVRSAETRARISASDCRWATRSEQQRNKRPRAQAVA